MPRLKTVTTFAELRARVEILIVGCENSISAQEGQPGRVFAEVEKRTWEHLLSILPPLRTWRCIGCKRVAFNDSEPERCSCNARNTFVEIA